MRGRRSLNSTERRNTLGLLYPLSRRDTNRLGFYTAVAVDHLTLSRLGETSTANITRGPKLCNASVVKLRFNSYPESSRYKREAHPT